MVLIFYVSIMVFHAVVTMHGGDVLRATGQQRIVSCFNVLNESMRKVMKSMVALEYGQFCESRVRSVASIGLRV